MEINLMINERYIFNILSSVKMKYNNSKYNNTKKTNAF